MCKQIFISAIKKQRKLGFGMPYDCKELKIYFFIAYEKVGAWRKKKVDQVGSTF